MLAYVRRTTNYLHDTTTYFSYFSNYKFFL